MSAPAERAEAIDAAARGAHSEALHLAQNVSEAWYRCQSLAAVARFAPEAEVVFIVDKALDAAREAGDAYKRVAVSAWPVCALAERGKNEAAQKLLASLINEAAQIMPPVSRVCALAEVWQASGSLPPALKQPVLDALVAACRADNSWKAGRILSYSLLILASEDAEQAHRIAGSMRDGPYRRWTQKRLAAHQTETGRSFFHRRTPQEDAEMEECFKKREEEWEDSRKKRREKQAKQRERAAFLHCQKEAV